MGRQEPQKQEVPSPEPGKERPHAPAYAKGRMAGEQLSRKGPGRPGGYKV